MVNACKYISLAVNIGRTKYLKVGRHRGLKANEHIAIGINSYEKERNFKYLGSFLMS